MTRKQGMKMSVAHVGSNFQECEGRGSTTPSSEEEGSKVEEENDQAIRKATSSQVIDVGLRSSFIDGP